MKEGRSEEGLRAGKTNGERSGVVQEPGEFRVGQCFVEYWISWLNSVLGNDLPESLVRDMTQLLRLQKTTHSTMEEASLFFIYFLNWNIIYLQCVSFWNTTKWFSYIYTHIHTHIYIHITESLSCIYIYIYIYICFPGGSEVKNLPAMQAMQETQVGSLGREDPLEEGLANPVLLPR